jgi:uncharacterized membrane protein YeaQ/YmgE (transglycosylase-associated protein family)
MTETLISLLSILIGILGANSSSYFYRQYSFGTIGNTIAGVFGSIFFIKFFAKLGFDPVSIMQNGTFHSSLFIINCLVSFIGGILAVLLIGSVQ